MDRFSAFAFFAVFAAFAAVGCGGSGSAFPGEATDARALDVAADAYAPDAGTTDEGTVTAESRAGGWWRFDANPDRFDRTSLRGYFSVRPVEKRASGSLSWYDQENFRNKAGLYEVGLSGGNWNRFGSLTRPANGEIWIKSTGWQRIRTARTVVYVTGIVVFKILPRAGDRYRASVNFDPSPSDRNFALGQTVRDLVCDPRASRLKITRP